MNTIEENLDDKTRAALKAFRESLCAAAKKAYIESSIGPEGGFSTCRNPNSTEPAPADAANNH